MKIPVSILIAASLAGCVAPANAPSLDRRPIELRGDPVDAPTVLAPTLPIDSSLQAQIAALLTDVRLGDTAFQTIDRELGPAVRAGRSAPVGSERWISGEQARSALEAARQRSAAALAELDALVLVQAEDAAANPAHGGLAQAQAAAQTAEAIVARQTERIAELSR